MCPDSKSLSAHRPPPWCWDPHLAISYPSPHFPRFLRGGSGARAHAAGLTRDFRNREPWAALTVATCGLSRDTCF